MRVDWSVETKEKWDVEEGPVEEKIEEEDTQPAEETKADDSKTDDNKTYETVEAKEHEIHSTRLLIKFNIFNPCIVH